jgi:hypothetical protein
MADERRIFERVLDHGVASFAAGPVDKRSGVAQAWEAVRRAVLVRFHDGLLLGARRRNRIGVTAWHSSVAEKMIFSISAVAVFTLTARHTVRVSRRRCPLRAALEKSRTAHLVPVGLGRLRLALARNHRDGLARSAAVVVFVAARLVRAVAHTRLRSWRRVLHVADDAVRVVP